MARKFLVSIDHNKLESLGFTLQNLAANPGAPATGQIYHNTANKLTYKYDGAAWVSYIQSSGGTMTGIFQTAAGTTAIAGGLKLTSGALKTTPVSGDSGSIEFNGTSLSFIDSTGTRNTLAISGAVIQTATLTAPVAGFTIAQTGTSSDPIYTFTLTNDLAAVEALATTGIVRRTGADTWSAGTAVSLTTEVTGILPATSGGTGLSTTTVGALIQGAATNTFSALASVATGNVLISGGVGVASSWGKVGLATHVSGILPSANGGTGVANSFNITLAGALATTGAFTTTLAATATATHTLPAGSGTLLSTFALVTPAQGGTGVNNSTNTLTMAGSVSFTGEFNPTFSSSVTATHTLPGGTGTLLSTFAAVTGVQGGTGQTTYAVGDLLQGAATNTLTKLAAVATGNVLISGGVGVASSWGKVDLTTHVSGIAPVANGGTGRNTATTAYGLIAAGTTAAGVHQTLAAGLTTQILVGGGTSALPVWTTATGTGAPVRETSPALLGTPTAPTATAGTNTTQIATTAFVRGEVDLAVTQGLDIKGSVRVKTTGSNITLASAAPNTLDGVTLVASDRILVTDQNTGAENGIYFVSTLGTGANGVWVRSLDADSSAEVTAGLFTFVEEGTANADSGWVLATNNPITLGTTALVFTQFSGAGSVIAGAGLTRTGTTLDVIGGNGITVGADLVSVDTAVVVRKYAQLVGDGSATSIAVTHSLSSQDITVSIRDASTNLAVDTDWAATSTSVCTFTFAVAPTSNQYKVVIHA